MTEENATTTTAEADPAPAPADALKAAEPESTFYNGETEAQLAARGLTKSGSLKNS
jgi:hypothetical protein